MGPQFDSFLKDYYEFKCHIPVPKNKVTFAEFENDPEEALITQSFNQDMVMTAAAVPIVCANFKNLKDWARGRSTPFRTIVVDRELLLAFLSIVKNSEFYGYDFLVDLYAFDNFGGEFYRFVVIYRIRNLERFSEIAVVAYCPEGWPIDSVQDIYRAAVWCEREAWELVGVYFNFHRGLRRLLTDYNFKGHPLRKDFPVTGYLECFYSPNLGMIEFVKVEFMQECRVYEFYENWETNEPIQYSTLEFHRNTDFYFRRI